MLNLAVTLDDHSVGSESSRREASSARLRRPRIGFLQWHSGILIRSGDRTRLRQNPWHLSSAAWQDLVKRQLGNMGKSWLSLESAAKFLLNSMAQDPNWEAKRKGRDLPSVLVVRLSCSPPPLASVKRSRWLGRQGSMGHRNISTICELLPSLPSWVLPEWHQKELAVCRPRVDEPGHCFHPNDWGWSCLTLLLLAGP